MEPDDEEPTGCVSVLARAWIVDGLQQANMATQEWIQLIHNKSEADVGLEIRKNVPALEEISHLVDDDKTPVTDGASFIAFHVLLAAMTPGLTAAGTRQDPHKGAYLSARS